MEDPGDDRDFVVLFGSARDGGVAVSVLESPAGEGEGIFRLPGGAGEWSPVRLELARACRDLALEDSASIQLFPAQEIGRKLFGALFSDRIGSLYAESRGLVGQNEVLRLKLRFRSGGKTPEEALLHNLPWELLYDPEKAEFLSLSRRTPIVRSLEVGRPGPSPAQPAVLRVLIVISNPVGLQYLELPREQRCIEEAWGSDAAVQVDVLEDARVETLREALLQGPVHCLHFMGHGDLDPTTGKARLFFESRDGSPDPVSGETLATLLKDAESLRFVFLNACETAKSPVEPEADALTAMSAALVMGGVPAVLAMQFPISDEAAFDFSRVVHQRLAAGDAIESAVTAGRRAVYTAHRDSLEWAIPVLFTRLRDGHLFTVRPTGRKAHHAEATPDVRIEGTWLADISFPAGERNWHRMTLRQDGMEVKGESTCYKGYSEGFRYLMQGMFRRQILACFYTIADDTRIEQGAMVLMLGKDGMALKGFLSYYDNETEKIASTPCEWRRDDSVTAGSERQRPSAVDR